MAARVLFSILYILIFHLVNGQVVTKEDSLYSGILKPRPGINTFFSGYGEGVYRRELKLDTSNFNVPRVVTFFGHRFNKNILFFSALELRDIRVSGGASGGEVSLEQAFIKFNIDSLNYFQAGLFLPRIGLLNENHLPTNYRSNERPLVETILLPGVWREMGLGFYGGSKKIRGFYYNIALLNGLNYRKLGENNTGIREATLNGPTSANNLAMSGALLYYIGETLRFQTSFYYGGTVGLTKQYADSLNLRGGPFGTPALTNEANLQFRKRGWSLRLLGARVYIPDAGKINEANDQEHPVAKTMIGGYAELAYNFLFHCKADRIFLVFARMEALDLDKKPAEGEVKNGLLKQQNILTGVNYSPISGVVLKADFKYSVIGYPPQDFISIQKYYHHREFISIGFGYSF